jgi:hypothetical protein
MNPSPVGIVCHAVTCSLALLLGCGPVGGQEREEPAAEQRAAHQKRMKEVAAGIRLYATAGGKDSAVKLADEPVLSYADNTRDTPESSLWIWGAKGRPSAILAIEYHAKYPKGPSWLVEIASLSPEPIAAEHGDSFAWTAKAGLTMARLADAPPPAERPARRLAQMKELRDRFAAHEFAMIGGRIELRSLTSPLYRYADADQGVIDGAIFAFASGTNPEVLLVLEAHQAQGKTAQWRYGLVQLAGAEVVVHLDGKPVWQRENADPPAVRDTYVNGWIPAESPPPTIKP